MKSIVVTRIVQGGKLFTSEDFEDYFKNDNLFGTTSTALTYDKFKKTFFP